MENTVEAPKLETIVDSLFNGDADTTYTLQHGDMAGKKVTFQTAKLKQIAAITRLLGELVNRIPKDKFSKLIGEIAADQVELLAAGTNKDAMELAASTRVRNLLGGTSDIAMMIGSCMDVLPRMMGAFINLTSDEIDNLELDDAVMIVVGIVGLNYSFFTQRFAPLFATVLAEWSKKNGSAQPAPTQGQMVEVNPREQ